MDVLTMIVVIVVVSCAFSALMVHWGLKHDEKKMALQAGQITGPADVARLEQILVANHAEMAKLRDRVHVLERLVTDEDRNLAGEIDRLKSQPGV